MPAMPTIEVPVTIDTTPAIAVAEALAHYHRSLAADAGYALEALTKRLDEIEAERALKAAERERERKRITDTPERFETDAEARAAGADPDELGDTIGIEITD